MDLNALKIFIKVGETQSFTKAAQALGLTQSGSHVQLPGLSSTFVLPCLTAIPTL
ncbi:LysR family transcriptional regulator [Klebsiella michiganensis]|uniref:LysR family transcriptional regulator n=1 Tax=Klebsiella michiganensis TaxID=1134687 RepID=UPI003BF7F664|nr:LysR family transcriptional regulator [Klebsiella michiganensis]